MQVYEINLQTSERGEWLIPAEIQKILQARRKARVIFLFEDEGAEWKRLTGAAFSAGFSEPDAAHDDLSANEMAKLAEQGGAFDFLAAPDEDIYSDDDLKVRYKSITT